MSATLRPIITPFAQYKFRRDAQFNPLPRTMAIDIRTAGMERCDADVREVSDAGVLVFRSATLELIAWDDITWVRVAALDADGKRTAVRVVRADDRIAA